MRKVIVAALALSPMLLNAQATVPAPTPAKAPVLQSKLTPATYIAPTGSNGSSTASTSPVSTSTGVTAPKLISSIDVIYNREFPAAIAGFDRTVVVSMIVGQDGKPSNLKIVRSADFATDQSILTAVSQYRYQPGTLDNQPAAIPVNLVVTVHRQ